jgi:hypothetical protein
LNSDDSTKRLQVYELPELDICMSSVKQPESRKRFSIFWFGGSSFFIKIKELYFMRWKTWRKKL